MAPVVPGVLTIFAALIVRVQTSPHSAEHLTKSLFVFRETACESDSLHMRCPHGTAIDVLLAQFGPQASGKQACPAVNMRPGQLDPHRTADCLSESSLRIVLDLCQNQRQCKVTADSSTFGEDPCPGTTKYLKVAYRCNPSEFQTRVTCEGEEMILRCQKNRVIAVFSAMFGRSGQGQMECPSQKRIVRVCKSSSAQKKVVDACHGKRNCNIPSDVRTFGDPCIPGTPKYLRVVFTCVPKRIMKEGFTPYQESHENHDMNYDLSDKTRSPPGGTDTDSGLAGPGERNERVKPGKDGQLNYVPKQSTHGYENMKTVSPPTQTSKTGGLSSQEKLILYIVVGSLSVCLFIMVIVITKLVHDKRKKSRKSKCNSETNSEEKPCQTTLKVSPTSENKYSHHITTPADTFLDHSTDLSDTLDIMQYNLRSLTSQPPTLSRPATNSLPRAHFRDSPNRAFRSLSPANTRTINNSYR